MNMYEYLENKFKTESERSLSEKLDRLAALRSDLELQPAPNGVVTTVTAIDAFDRTTNGSDVTMSIPGLTKVHKVKPNAIKKVPAFVDGATRTPLPEATEALVKGNGKPHVESYFTSYRNMCKTEKKDPNMSITTAIMTVLNSSGKWFTSRELQNLITEEKVTKTPPNGGNVSNGLNELFRKSEIKKRPSKTNGNAFSYHTNSK